MTDMGFGNNPKQEIVWNEYIGKWVTIKAQGIPTTYAGKMIEIKGGEYAVLSPFQSGHFDVERGFICEMSNERSLIPLVGSGIEPTTKKNIEDYCKYTNKKSDEERKKQKKESSKKLKK